MMLSDLDVLALTIYGEARGEPIEGKIAVGNVCRNRLKTNHWGASYERVCLAPMQFSCWTPKGGLSDYTLIQNLVRQIMLGQQPPDPVLTECYWVATGIQNKAAQDNTERATFYYVTGTAMPHWAVGHLPVCVIAKHSFFSGIS